MPTIASITAQLPTASDWRKENVKRQTSLVKREGDARGLVLAGKGSFVDGCAGIDWAVKQNRDYVLWIDDDAEPYEHFRRELDRLLTAFPEHIISLYTGRKPLAKGAIHKTRNGLTGVAFVMPSGMARECRRWLLDNAVVSQLPGFMFDYAINVWCEFQDIPIYTTIPSFVEHGDPENSFTNSQHMPGRRAAVPPSSDIDKIDWTKQVPIEVESPWTRMSVMALPFLSDPLKYWDKAKELYINEQKKVSRLP